MSKILTQKLKSSKAFAALAENKGLLSLSGLPEALIPIALNELSRERKLLCVAGNDWTALNISAAIPGSVYLPPRDTLLRPAVLSRDAAAARVEALSRLGDAPVVCLSAGALRQRLCPPDVFASGFITVSYGEEIAPEALINRLVRTGYERAALCDGRCQFARRGDILDVTTVSGCWRIEFFGDTVDRITTFDPATQRSEKEQLQKITLPPAHEFVLDRAAQKKLIAFCEEQCARMRGKLEFEYMSGKLEGYLTAAQEGAPFDDMRNMLTQVYPPASVFDYTGDRMTVFDGYTSVCACAAQADAEFSEALTQAYTSGYALPGMEHMYRSFESVSEEALSRPCADICNLAPSPLFAKGERADMGARQLHTVGGVRQLPELIKKRTEAGDTLLLCAGSQSRVVSLSKSLLSECVLSTDEEEPSPVYVVADDITRGFELPGLLVLGTQDIYGKAAPRRKRKQSKLSSLFDDLSEGDIVVHDAYGKGRYLGLQTKEVTGILRDYIILEYRDGDKLYLPVDQLSRVSKYVSGSDAPPQLSKLGGHEWENAKAKARASLADMTDKLFSLYKKRVSARGYMFSPDTVWQTEFEDAFPYEETEGQSAAITDIKADMESERVMDRLLLGDVGYGKTEVAMRACMKAVCDHKQCALLAPTTLLCAQHFETFRQRFEGFPVNIVTLSRFVPPAEQKKALAMIADGRADIAIGTHRLLSADVAFHDLGLLIIDEEHRFGVAAKERIKELKTSVDVLSMTATPIPRTLEMSLTGIRDLSAIETPIEERIPVSTFVLEYSEDLVREAVLREKARGGQVYFVCRKISTLGYLATQLEKNLPDVSYRIGHGQMGREELESVMEDFVAGKFDVLLCTTIVESGLDIKTANTMIIYEADCFGLSELYQLKGRVGRSSVPAYAYLTYIAEERLSSDALRRLSALRDFTEFGSGAKIALRDLEIRGAGNLMGAEQSGHMENVGYEMYLRFMKEAVSELKGESLPARPADTSVELMIDAHIDAAYIESPELRVEAYRRIGAVSTRTQALDMLSELTERYGEPPQPVKNLVTVSLLRSYAQARGVSSVTRKSAFIELKFLPEKCDMKAVAAAAATLPGAKLARTELPALRLYRGRGIADVFKCLSALPPVS